MDKVSPLNLFKSLMFTKCSGHFELKTIKVIEDSNDESQFSFDIDELISEVQARFPQDVRSTVGEMPFS
ncbi:hypothetical protein WA026_003866 [Henosepilachna vigintioctopunctata]|uniref:Uncharacterized protein n=1 Tax=Henosepilachna vigintioctopunctata TaxID=420089 RepID=A0AAW1UE72_9CUCU